MTIRCDVCGKEQAVPKARYASFYEAPNGWHTEDIRPTGLRSISGAEPKIEHYCSDICRVAGLGNHALKNAR